ncbi:MAG: rhomboid family intramembrane serine protease [Polyangiales bacterium]
MRVLTTFERETDARTLGDAMFADGIETTVSPSREGGSVLWVHDDGRLDDARALLELYRADPKDPRIVDAVGRASKLRREATKKDRAAERRIEAARDELERREGIGNVTVFLLLSLVGVYVLGLSAGTGALARVLAFVDFEAASTGGYRHGFEDVLRGQVWRLVTPIALHDGFLGAFFDGLWLFYLCTPFERMHRSRWVALFVLGAAIVTNVTEVAFFGNVGVHGMMGVADAIFAYLFVRPRLDPRFPELVSTTLAILVAAITLIGFAGAPARIGQPLSAFAYGALIAALASAVGRRR